MDGASRQLQSGSGSVRDVAVALTEYAALLPASMSAVDADVSSVEASCSGRLAQTCSDMLASRQHAVVGSGCQLLSVLIVSCPAQLLLQQHLQWLQQLSALIHRQQQLPGDVWLSAAAALQGLFRRLGALIDAPGVRRAASTAITKLLPAITPLLAITSPAAAQPAASSSVVDELHVSASMADRQQAAVGLLAALLDALPQALRSQAKQLELTLALLVAGEGCPQALRAAAAHALAKLPRASGTAESWSATAQQLLWAMHVCLDAAFSELGPAAAAAAGAARDVLAPGAADAPLPAAVRSHATAPKQQLQVLGACMGALHQLLSQPFPEPAPLPVAGVVQLVARVQALAGSTELGTGHSQQSLAKHVESLQLANSVLPGSYALVQALMSAMGGGVLAHCRPLCDLLAQPLRRVAAQDMQYIPAEAALYHTVRFLVYRGGAAAARWLAPAVVDAAMWRLYSLATTAGFAPPSHGAAPHPAKKQKKSKKGQVEEANQDFAGSQSLGSPLAAVHRQLDCAVLKLLEALLVVGSALLPAGLRLKTDALLAHFAASTAAAAAKLACTDTGDCGSFSQLQLAAYRALLASVLAPLGHRPPFLGQALSLFKAALHCPNDQLMQFSHQALLCCEAVLHPRAVPTPILLNAANPATPQEINCVPAFAASLFSDVFRAAPSAVDKEAHANAGDGPVEHPGFQLAHQDLTAAVPSMAPAWQQQYHTSSHSNVPAAFAPWQNAPAPAAAEAMHSTAAQAQQPGGSTAAAPALPIHTLVSAGGLAAASVQHSKPADPAQPRQQQGPLVGAGSSVQAAALPRAAAAAAGSTGRQDIDADEPAGGSSAGHGDVLMQDYGSRGLPDANEVADSDDSEGPLPEIDSGVSSDED